MFILRLVILWLQVLGEPVDTLFFDPSSTTPLPLPALRSEVVHAQPTFRFLSIFKWEARKGWDALLSAYFLEFATDEAVELIIKTKPFHSSSNFEALVAEWAASSGLPYKERPPLRILDSEIPLVQLPRLYASADAFVLPSRGEGWGRPHVEAMAMGLPVIATNWSGPTAFLDERVGYPLDYHLVPVGEDMKLPGHSWAEPNIAHLRQLMRHLVNSPNEGRAKGRKARERMKSEFGIEALALKVETELQRIGTLRSRSRKRTSKPSSKVAMRDEL